MSKKKKNKLEKSNTQIMNITYMFLLIFVGMIIYFVKFEAFDSEEIINNSYNKREEVLSQSIIRGSIISADGEILAQTVTNEDGSETRYYPYGSLFSHTVGYSTHGITGIERMANYKLLTSNTPMLEYASNEFKGEKNEGDNVYTTLDVPLTKVSYDALGDYQGAVIAIEPKTGKILAMISKPDFDPNKIDAEFDTIISNDNNSNLLNRATNGLYTPGSTFKLFTLYEYIRENSSYESFGFDCHGKIQAGDTTISCAGGMRHGMQDLKTSFANSCNGAFANMGLTLNRTSFKETCDSLLFNTELPLNFDYKKSKFVLENSSSEFEVMQTSMGQGKTLITPIHLCMVASALANDGVLMKPYMITDVKNQNGKIIKEYLPTEYKRLFGLATTNELNTFLREVVTSGTGSRLKSDKYEAYGKTGTAQINDGKQENSLFMGFAKSGDKSIAVCVIMEDVPNVSTPAVPVAKAVFDEYFE